MVILNWGMVFLGLGIGDLNPQSSILKAPIPNSNSPIVISSPIGYFNFYFSSIQPFFAPILSGKYEILGFTLSIINLRYSESWLYFCWLKLLFSNLTLNLALKKN